jgi:hypothetical protein
LTCCFVGRCRSLRVSLGRHLTARRRPKTAQRRPRLVVMEQYSVHLGAALYSIPDAPQGVAGVYRPFTPLAVAVMAGSRVEGSTRRRLCLRHVD